MGTWGPDDSVDLATWPPSRVGSPMPLGKYGLKGKPEPDGGHPRVKEVLEILGCSGKETRWQGRGAGSTSKKSRFGTSPARPLTLLSCRPCVSKVMTSRIGFGSQPCDCRTRVYTSAVCQTTATTTRRSTKPRRCCACSRASHRPTCRLLRPCPISRAAAHAATDPPAPLTPTTRAPWAAPPLSLAQATRAHQLRVPLQSLDPESQSLLPPPQPTQPPLPSRLLPLLRQRRHHWARLSFCARGMAPVRNREKEGRAHWRGQVWKPRGLSWSGGCTRIICMCILWQTRLP